MWIKVLNKIGNREPKHLVSEEPQFFIIAAWIVLKRLEIIPVVGQAAVGENALPNSLRLNLRKWWQYANSKSGDSRRIMVGGASWGRHGRENGQEYRQVSMLKGVESGGGSCLVHPDLLGNVCEYDHS